MTTPYLDRAVALLTQHGKEAVIAPALRAATGLEDARTARLVWRLRLLDREREARRCLLSPRRTAASRS